MASRGYLTWQRFLAYIIAMLVLGASVVTYLYNTNDTFKREVDYALDPYSKPVDVIVSSEGGTWRFDGGSATITVPKGAVTKPTTLRYGGVKVLRQNDPGPLKGLRSSATSFDVSLEQDGSAVQPKKPLVMQVPRSGNFAGKGTPFAYTVLDGKIPYALLDTKQQKDGTVSIQLPHLSPKVLTYLSDEALVALFKEKAAIEDRGTCKQEITVNGAKVRMGQKRGWSLDNDSAIFACLVAGDGTANVGIVNRIDYMLSVAATDNLRVVTAGADLETELVKKLNNSVFPNDKVKALLANGEKLVAEAKPQSLPATVELQADPKTFYAESAYNVVGFFIGLMTGVGKGGEVIKLVAKALDSAAIVSCFQDAFQNLGDSPSVWDFGNTIASCFFVVVDFVASEISADWFSFKALEAAGLVVDTITTAYNGIRLQFNNTMRVGVKRVTPPCPSDDSIPQILRDGDPFSAGLDFWNSQLDVCDFPWAAGYSETGTHDRQTDTDGGFILYYENGAWRMAHFGQSYALEPICNRVSQPIRAYVAC